MKYILLVLGLLSTGTSWGQSANEIAYWHIDARGGHEVISAINNITLENIVVRSGTEMKSTQRILVQKAMRSDTKIGKKTWIKAFDGINAWYINPKAFGGTGKAVRDSTTTFASLLRQTNPFPLLNYLTQPYKLSRLPNENLDSTACYRLQIVYLTDEAVIDFWISTKDAFIYKMRTQNDNLQETMYYKNYKKVNGVWFPFLMDIEDSKGGVIQVITQKIKVNEKMKESIFQFPK
jgi:hypothetical protein